MGSTNGSKSCDDILGIDGKSKGLLFKPRLGLGSTDNENIALRRNHRELELLFRKQKMLGIEQEYVMKIIDLNSKSTQVNYKRLTKRVGRIRSHLTEDEIKEMENDVRKQEFANKYRNILRNQTMGEGDCMSETTEEVPKQCGEDSQLDPDEKHSGTTLATVPEDGDDDVKSQVSETRDAKNFCHTSQGFRPPSRRQSSKDFSTRPKTCPNLEADPDDDDDDTVGEIIPSLENLLDQLHNIKPQQFYENQRKLKLYDIQLCLEELETKKQALFRDVDAIVNWDKKKEIDEEEEERRKREEEENKKPLKRKTTFMRSVLRNFSMELMMKTMQYGWADLGKCRYLRKRGGDEEGEEGANTLAKDSMKIQLPNQEPDDDGSPPPSKVEPGFGPDGKMIRTADLLGLK